MTYLSYLDAFKNEDTCLVLLKVRVETPSCRLLGTAMNEVTIVHSVLMLDPVDNTNSIFSTATIHIDWLLKVMLES